MKFDYKDLDYVILVELQTAYSLGNHGCGCILTQRINKNLKVKSQPRKKQNQTRNENYKRRFVSRLYWNVRREITGNLCFCYFPEYGPFL